MLSHLEDSTARRLSRLLTARPIAVDMHGDPAGLVLILPLVEELHLADALQEPHDPLDLDEVAPPRPRHVPADFLGRKLQPHVVLGHVVQPGSKHTECFGLRPPSIPARHVLLVAGRRRTHSC